MRVARAQSRCANRERIGAMVQIKAQSRHATFLIPEPPRNLLGSVAGESRSWFGVRRSGMGRGYWDQCWVAAHHSSSSNRVGYKRNEPGMLDGRTWDEMPEARVISVNLRRAR